MNVLLGITGGIAAFKSVELVRLLRSGGHQVRCTLTRAAASFVAPLTLEILTGNKVLLEEYLTASTTRTKLSEATSDFNGEEAHIAVAAWADVYCVVPATAHSISRLALGLADDFLTTTALAFSGPMVIAPAMHSTMWNQSAIQENVTRLKQRGVLIVGPVDGELASGESGIGRMAEPMMILAALEGTQAGKSLAGTKILISAGPTQEKIDPVRFISNRSSGRMGFALAEEAARRGGKTYLVAGPVALQTPAGVDRVDVTSAAEMRTQIMNRASIADIIIMTAAVADFRPVNPAARKIKKRDGVPSIELESNPDILAELATHAPDALRIGFAAETNDLEENAAAKLSAKGAHMIVANDVSRADIGFDATHNEVVVFSAARLPEAIGLESKVGIAVKLWDIFSRELASRADKAVAISS